MRCPARRPPNPALTARGRRTCVRLRPPAVERARGLTLPWEPEPVERAVTRGRYIFTGETECRSIAETAVTRNRHRAIGTVARTTPGAGGRIRTTARPRHPSERPYRDADRCPAHRAWRPSHAPPRNGEGRHTDAEPPFDLLQRPAGEVRIAGPARAEAPIGSRFRVVLTA